MIKYMKTDEQGELQIISTFAPKCWVDLVNPTDDEVEDIMALTGIPEEMLKAALDEEETARAESDDGCVMFVVDSPVMVDTDRGDMYSTIPLSLIYNNLCLVTVSLRGNSVLKDFMSGRGDVSSALPVDFILNFMYENAKRYSYFLRQIEKKSNKIQDELHKTMRNSELMQLLQLQNSLVYFSTSLNSNLRVYGRLERLAPVIRNEEYRDLLDDVLIENKQAVETCTIYRDILTVTMDAFSSVISNNANNVMKLLTIVTVIIAIPTLIAGLWGMNMPVPWQETAGVWAFWTIVGISLVITVVCAVVMVRFSANTSIKVEHKIRKKRKL